MKTTVENLFQPVEKTERRPVQKQISPQALAELKAHVALVEELFYPRATPLNPDRPSKR
ncbi:MAG: hypothetical protein ABL995_10015 [Bryobacteraceae bacterium]